MTESSEPKNVDYENAVYFDPEVTEDDGELTEELAYKTTIEKVFDQLTSKVEKAFVDVFDASLSGNPVMTHVLLVDCAEEISGMIQDVRSYMITQLAERGDTFDEQGVLLRKQMVEEEDN